MERIKQRVANDVAPGLYTPPHLRCGFCEGTDDVVYPEDGGHVNDAVDLSKRRRSLLGTASQLCESFFHIEQTPEASMEAHCIACSDHSCKRKSVTCMAFLVSNTDGSVVLKKRYTNCTLHTRVAALHAEEFLVRDEHMRGEITRLSGRGGSRLDLYLTYQPCNRSGGHTSQTIRNQTKSCSDLLVRYNDTFLKKNNSQLRIRFAYFYRAHWDITESETCMQKYGTSIRRSREGIMMLLRENIDVAPFTSEDWNTVLAECDAGVSKVISEVSWLLRHDMDGFNRRFMEQMVQTFVAEQHASKS